MPRLRDDRQQRAQVRVVRRAPHSSKGVIAWPLPMMRSSSALGAAERRLHHLERETIELRTRLAEREAELVTVRSELLDARESQRR